MSKLCIVILDPGNVGVVRWHLLRDDVLASVSSQAAKLDQASLPLLDKLLRLKKVRQSDIMAIGLIQGTMSLASQRLALSEVNALGWAWQVKTFSLTLSGSLTSKVIQTASKKAKKGFLPAEYSQEPRIG